MEFRLVLDVHTHTWGSHGLELERRYYFLQQRENQDTKWKTLPVTLHKDLTKEEQAEILACLSSTAPRW